MVYNQTIMDSVTGFLDRFVEVIINPIIMLLFAVALLYFFWGLFRYMMALAQGDNPSDSKQHMLWGILGMVIMFSVGGIIGLIQNSIGAEDANSVNVTGGAGDGLRY